MKPNTETINSILAKEGKYLTFALNNESYGIEILKVMEIIGMMDITPIPKSPDFVMGIINLRGKIVPVISLRQKFNMEDLKFTEETCIVVVTVQDVLVGVVIDKVNDVVDIKKEEIEEPPAFNDKGEDAILGIGKVSDDVVILLNIEEILFHDVDMIKGLDAE